MQTRSLPVHDKRKHDRRGDGITAKSRNGKMAVLKRRKVISDTDERNDTTPCSLVSLGHPLDPAPGRYTQAGSASISTSPQMKQPYKPSENRVTHLLSLTLRPRFLRRRRW